jgi:hypothetical protein
MRREVGNGAEGAGLDAGGAALAGAEGIEPSHGGIKIRCLTAWLRPKTPIAAAPLYGVLAPRKLPSVRCGQRLAAALGRVAVGCRKRLMYVGVGYPCAVSMTRTKKISAVVLWAAAAVWPLPSASAASFNCSTRDLSRAQVTICEDPQLSRLDDQVARKADTVARRMNYGQYLGLRYWQTQSAQQRDQCGADRACISAHYRAEARLLERLQQCLETRFARRACLHDTLSGDREASGSAAGRRGVAAPP